MSSVADPPEELTSDSDGQTASGTRVRMDASVGCVRPWFVVGITLLAVVLAGCVQPVGPAWSFESYEAKAKDTAETALSSVETGRLGAQTAKNDDSFAPYLAVLISEAEDRASSAHTTFDSVQPPDRKSDRLREKLDSLLVRANDALSQTRIAARRADFDEVAKQATPLRQSAKELRAFVQAHS
jgi:hypothetical protein